MISEPVQYILGAFLGDSALLFLQLNIYKYFVGQAEGSNKIHAQKYLTGSYGDKSPIYFYFTVYFGICQGLEDINFPFVIIIP